MCFLGLFTFMFCHRAWVYRLGIMPYSLNFVVNESTTASKHHQKGSFERISEFLSNWCCDDIPYWCQLSGLFFFT